MADVFVKSFTHLKDKHRADNALRLLQKVASLVKPIMRKRAWVLPLLSEFFPENPNLLGEYLGSHLWSSISVVVDRLKRPYCQASVSVISASSSAYTLEVWRVDLF